MDDDDDVDTDAGDPGLFDEEANEDGVWVWAMARRVAVGALPSMVRAGEAVAVLCLIVVS